MSETIAAISTAVGEAGIGIVRISGDEALNIGKTVFKPIKIKNFEDIENRKLLYGHIVEEENIIDEVLVAFMKEPYTYTRENMVEIYCHGGIMSVRKILELLLKKGARLAEAGEFTKRAFLNGRLDLAQAEAVIDIIQAKTDKSLEVSVNHLEGNLSKKINDIRDILLSMIAHIEASIDFPEDDVEDITYGELLESSLEAKQKISSLLLTADRGKILRDGLNTVILGKPNVGKSSLLNAILGESRAIVTDVPGTTRDILEEFISIDGIPLKIFDTAGIRDTEDIVEKIGVDRAKKTLTDADLIIAIFDISRELSEEDREIMDLIKDRKTIILLNKTDLANKYDMDYFDDKFPDASIIPTSIISEVGIDQLHESIKNMFYSGEVEISSDVVVTSLRHKNQLDKALENINRVIDDINMKIPIDALEVDLKNCWENLGEITGDTIGEDILDKIFSEFCIGK